jgi:flavodoxin
MSILQEGKRVRSVQKITSIATIMMISICLLSSFSYGVDMQKSATVEKILIVYLSRTGNTKAIAEIIQSNVGGDLVEIELKKPYPDNYKATVAQVERENETGYLSPLKTKIDSIDKYDVVFVGFPTWGMQLPPPIKSFLHQYDLSNKTVIPFNTNAGYGIGSSFQTVKELCKNSKILEGFEIKGGVERDGILFVMKGKKEEVATAEIKNWLKRIGFSISGSKGN